MPSEGSEAPNRDTSRKVSSKALQSVEAHIVISKQRLQDYNTSDRFPDRTWDEGCGGSLPAPVLPSQYAQEHYYRVTVPPSRYLAPQLLPQQDGQYCSARSGGIAGSLKTLIKPPPEAHRRRYKVH